MTPPRIRPLTPERDLAAITAFYAEAPDYFVMADGQPPGAAKARAFFTDGPPGCDPAAAHRLGLFLDGRLSGLAELSFGFPQPGDAYLGLLLLGPWARGAGLGRIFLADIEARARAASSPALTLAVLEANPRGRAFWEREGFTATGHTGSYTAGDTTHHLTRMSKPL
ncbi:GNAT family N-acetyltransferase [Vannielia litorea]|uniref:Acetyltransferase (GNAT) family protein n=1 Tax=Vannielia litorea TaxID=1217970 RepID=A0A1N6EII7_9RHOB|nr:GNAT family N-acetyltransferase [Vannielia litorea]SIN82856.1 Acetyltransferase (GNAT) family protein [Vannielia litorea]